MNTSLRESLIIAWVMLVAIDVAIQVAMKVAGDELHGIAFGSEWVLAAVSSGWVWFALVGYGMTLFLWLAILRSSPLSAAFPTTALVYVFVPLCGWVLLREPFRPGLALGIALILGGVWLQGGRTEPHQPE